MNAVHTLPLILLGALAAVPAQAQTHGSHGRPDVPQAVSACTPEHAAMGHCTLPDVAAKADKTQMNTPPACSPEHAAMGHCTPTVAKKAPANDEPMPPPACSPEHAAMGHCTPTPPSEIEGTDLPAGKATAPPAPTDHAADAIYGPGAMAMGRHHLFAHHGSQRFARVMFDIAEVKFAKGKEAYAWGGEAWYGGDLDRLVIKTEGEGQFGGGLESAELQALFSRAIDPYFDLQAGVRYDFEPSPSRVYATVGIEGLAPGFFDVEGALFLSDRGELLGRIEGYSDQRITQKLILQPRAELNFAAQDSEDTALGAGLTDAEIGLRLRYDIAREFSPYIGVEYERSFGRTRDFLRADGEKPGGLGVVLGVRTWF